MHCHASIYVPYKKLGNGDLTAGFEKMNQMPYMEARKLVSHPIACIDCHDPETMALRITRRDLLKAFARTKPRSEWQIMMLMPWQRGRKCDRTCAVNAMLNIISRDLRND